MSAVLLLTGCLLTWETKVNYSYVCEAEINPNQGSARLLSEGEILLVSMGNSVLTDVAERDIVELTDNQFKMLVFCKDDSSGAHGCCCA